MGEQNPTTGTLRWLPKASVVLLLVGSSQLITWHQELKSIIMIILKHPNQQRTTVYFAISRTGHPLDRRLVVQHLIAGMHPFLLCTTHNYRAWQELHCSEDDINNL